MITLLWLIRSNQPVTKYSKETVWQDDWFFASLMTCSILLLDLLIFTFVFGLITNL